jgi:hypothetical protein
MTTVRAIIKEVRTHWISVTSARRLVIMVGTAMLIEPIITEWVSDPRMIDRLMAHRAEGVVVRGALGARATVENAAAIVGRRRDGDTCYSSLALHRTLER